jgi:hypothetical protein
MISLILIIIAAIFNAIMDTLSFHYGVSVFSKWTKYEYFLNPQKSWVNKYKHNNPSLGPKFFGSKTFLVWTTDLWHLSKMLMITLLTLAIVFYTPLITTGYILIDILINSSILHFVFSACFELFWSKVLKLKK